MHEGDLVPAVEHEVENGAQGVRFARDDRSVAAAQAAVVVRTHHHGAGAGPAVLVGVTQSVDTTRGDSSSCEALQKECCLSLGETNEVVGRLESGGDGRGDGSCKDGG